MDRDNARHRDVVSLLQQLFYDLRAALTHRHRSERAVPRMAVGAEHHLSAAGQHFPGKLVDDGLMRRYINAAVFFRT